MTVTDCYMYSCTVVEPEIEQNLGFLARTMANFNIEELRLVNPQFTIGEEARTTAVHAQDLLDNTRIYENLEAAIQDTDIAVGTTGVDSSSSNVLRNPITPEAMAERAVDVDGDISILLGRESKGLSNDELEQCDFVVRIPTSDDYPVMNITHAGAVLFYELCKQNQLTDTETVGTRAQKETLEKVFKDMMGHLEYSTEDRERTMQCITNFVGRSFMHNHEANTLIGFFKELETRLGDTE